MKSIMTQAAHLLVRLYFRGGMDWILSAPDRQRLKLPYGYESSIYRNAPKSKLSARNVKSYNFFQETENHENTRQASLCFCWDVFASRIRPYMHLRIAALVRSVELMNHLQRLGIGAYWRDYLGLPVPGRRACRLPTRLRHVLQWIVRRKERMSVFDSNHQRNRM